MNEIAEPAPHASFPAIQPTARLPEVRHGAELAVDGARGVPARVERVAGFLRRVFVFEARVDVADEIWLSVSFCKCAAVLEKKRGGGGGEDVFGIGIALQKVGWKEEEGKGREGGRRGSAARGKRTIVVVVTDDDFFGFPEFAHLAPEVLVEGIKVVLQLARVHLVLWVVGWILV